MFFAVALALVCAFLSGLLICPIMNVVGYQVQVQRGDLHSSLTKALYNINIVLQVLIVVSFFRPVLVDPLTTGAAPLLTSASLDTIRVVMIMGTLVIKMALLRPCGQAYLYQG